MTYSEKLKSPNWQRVRLRIFERDNFTCKVCDSKEHTLHVHHKHYVFGKDPWDYPDTNFITLCEYCHSAEEHAKQMFKSVVNYSLQKGFTYSDLWERISALSAGNPDNNI